MNPSETACADLQSCAPSLVWTDSTAFTYEAWMEGTEVVGTGPNYFTTAYSATLSIDTGATAYTMCEVEDDQCEMGNNV